MKTQELIYARVKLPNIDKKLHIAKDCTEIFYYNEKVKVLLKKLDYQIKQNFEFIEIKLVPNGENGWYQITVTINLEKMELILKEPYNIHGRKCLFEIFKKCYEESTYNYVSHLILNLHEDLLKKNTNFIKWFIYCSNDTHPVFRTTIIDYRITKDGVGVISSNNEH
jgi:hypothetical protein